jgi:hypothetical protein
MSRPVHAVLRDGTEVAGWLCKANPEVWDVESHLAEHGTLASWRLMHSYRAGLVVAGQPVVIWLTGARAGVIAVGTTTGVPELRRHDGARDAGEVRARPHVPIDAVAVEPITKAELLDVPGFELSEVVRTPRSGNPLALSPAELDHIADHLEVDPWPVW